MLPARSRSPGEFIVGFCGLLLCLAHPAPTEASTSVAAASCLRLDQTAQALTDLHNLAPGSTATDLKERLAILQQSQQTLQADSAIASLPAMKPVSSTWSSLAKAFASLPANPTAQTAQAQVLKPMDAYRQALNVLITSITSCQP
jgi:hypothetical protein